MLDWLGSPRVGSNPNRTYGWGIAYAPFGERYASSGSPMFSFTGANGDTKPDLYDFQFRELHSSQGRWISPDPAGSAAVDPSNPQSWNRYAYVDNYPTGAVDPYGLFSDMNDAISYLRAMARMSAFFYAFEFFPLISYGSEHQQTGFHGFLGTPTLSSLGSPANNTKDCIAPNRLQKQAIKALGAIARWTGKTVGYGVGGSAGAGAVIGPAGAISWQLIVSPSGEAAFAFTRGANMVPYAPTVVPCCAWGYGVAGGFQATFSNAKTPSDLRGRSADFAGGAGAGWGGGADIAFGDNDIYQATLTGGAGFEAFAGAAIAQTTSVFPICR